MNIYLHSNSQSYIEYWKSILPESKLLKPDNISETKGVLITEHELYDNAFTHADLQLVILDNQPSFEKCISMMQKGVKAYGNVYMHKSHMYSALESIKEQKVWIYPDYTALLLSMTHSPRVEDNLETKMKELSLREKEIAKLIYNGLTNKEIAIELGITTNTIKNHTKKIYAKLDVNDRLSLFAYLKN